MNLPSTINRSQRRSLVIASQQNVVLGSDAPDAITFGRVLDLDNRQNPIGGKMRYGGSLSALIFGPSGSGKTTRFTIPFLLENEGRSLVVFDPKGEVYAVTGPFRRTLGPVYVVNPCGVLLNVPGYEDSKSDGFNPLLLLDPDEPSFNSDAALLADAMIKVESQDPHWDGSAQSLLAAIIMYVCIEAKRTNNVPTISDVRALLCLASEEPCKANDYEAKGIPALAAEMMQSSLAGLRNKASQFTEWTNEIRSIASAARRQTEPFDDVEIAEDLARGQVDFRELKKHPATVYIILPPEMIDRHAKWLRLVITSALRAVMRPRAPGEPKVTLVIEEFAALGHLKIIETVWALVRGYGIQIIPVLQDIHQLRSLYKDRWETFVGMAGAVLTFGARDLSSAKWMSERAGDSTEVAASYNSGSSFNQSGTSESSGLSWQQIKVPLIPPQKFMSLQEGFIFVWLARLSDTIAGYAPFYLKVRKLAARARANPYFN